MQREKGMARQAGPGAKAAWARAGSSQAAGQQRPGGVAAEAGRARGAAGGAGRAGSGAAGGAARRLTSDGVNRIKSIVQKNSLLEKSYSLLPICIWNHWQLVVICKQEDNDMPFLMLLDSLHMGEHTRIENELKNFLKIAYEGKGMRAVADEMKVIDLHVPKDKIRDIKLTQQSTTSISIASVGDAYEQVMGCDRTGRIRGIGTGPTSKSLWGSRSEQKLR
ncbi:hypothetical protein Taro_030103 [Colocasia esculenta]|uniref:Ubiquitin-like protease family profile domain-containing protein n=1 Tax=Colocasia esculenta TaxID=4460 RepID=A0A843VLK7_COLES|nr:hypothetical protein [Colocasia esculenta]